MQKNWLKNGSVFSPKNFWFVNPNWEKYYKIVLH